MNPKYNYSPALQEDARRFEERLNEAGDISSFSTTVRNKRHAGVTCWSWRVFGGESYGRLHEWSEAYFVTLIDRCSFLCVSGQRGTIAKSMHEEHLCVVALTSNGARNPVLSACLLPPCVIAYCSSSTSRWITGSCTWIMKILIIMVLCCARFNDCTGFVFIVWWCVGLSSLLLVSLHGD